MCQDREAKGKNAMSDWIQTFNKIFTKIYKTC